VSATGKKVLLGVALVAVLGIGYFAVNGYPPVGDDGKATIGSGFPDPKGPARAIIVTVSTVAACAASASPMPSSA